MPLYEYVCTQCKQHIEKIQKFSDAPLTECAKCGGKLNKVLSSAAIQFKGSGWYVTDYGRKHSTGASTKRTDVADSGNGDKTSTSEASKSESPKKEAPAAKDSEVKK